MYFSWYQSSRFFSRITVTVMVLSEIVTNFVTVTDGKHDVCGVQDLAGQCEQSVRTHQEFDNCCQNVQDWLVAANHKLAACEDRSGDKQRLLASQVLVEVGLCSVNRFAVDRTLRV
jgi:hypothetical protein